MDFNGKLSDFNKDDNDDVDIDSNDSGEPEIDK